MDSLQAMKTRSTPFLVALFTVAQLSGVIADEALKTEIEATLAKGAAWLESKQNESGSWGDETYPALTAMPLSALMRNSGLESNAKLPENLAKGYDFILSKQHRNGAIYGKGLATYNTALSLMSLTHVANQPGIEEAIRQARRFLINQQADEDVRGELDSPFDGGIGYGGSHPHSDLSNTHLAMEALYYSKQVLADRPGGVGLDLDWNAAIHFVSRCQNLEGSNDLDYIAVADQDRGGFVYFPGDSKAGEVEEHSTKTKVALRSYGSMSYAGLLSFIYADMDPNDKRITAVKKWLGRNYTLEENPHMGAQGQFYYYHTMAKALSLAGIDELSLADGGKANWKQELAKKLIAFQKADGSWINDGSSRWWEDDPILVTSYAMLSLKHVLQAL